MQATAAFAKEQTPADQPALHQASTPDGAAALSPAARSFSQPGALEFMLRSNPLGDFLDGLLHHQPASNKYDLLYDVLHNSRSSPSSPARHSKYNPVYALLHSAAMEVRLPS